VCGRTLSPVICTLFGVEKKRLLLVVVLTILGISSQWHSTLPTFWFIIVHCSCSERWSCRSKGVSSKSDSNHLLTFPRSWALPLFFSVLPPVSGSCRAPDGRSSWRRLWPLAPTKFFLYSILPYLLWTWSSKQQLIIILFWTHRASFTVRSTTNSERISQIAMPLVVILCNNQCSDCVNGS